MIHEVEPVDGEGRSVELVALEHLTQPLSADAQGLGGVGEVALGDLQVIGDGLIDLITAPFEEGAEVLLNQGGGSFAAPQQVSFNQETVGPVALKTSDVNNDGLDEVVALDNQGRLHVISNANGVLSASLEAAANQQVAANFIMVDLNGDGFDDVLSGDATIRSILSNDGSLDGLGETFAASARRLAAGDLDNNGSQDVASLSDEDGAAVFVLPNVGSGVLNVPFREALPLALPEGQGFTPRAVDLAVAEMNGDRVLDLVTAFNDGNTDFPLDGLSVILSTK